MDRREGEEGRVRWVWGLDWIGLDWIGVGIGVEVELVEVEVMRLTM